MLFFLGITTYCDSPENYGFLPQDPATPAMEGMIFFHHYIMIHLYIVGIGIMYMLYQLIISTNKSEHTLSKIFTHSNILEIT
jgi:replication initiation and membrane attachment protein DnaB